MQARSALSLILSGALFSVAAVTGCSSENPPGDGSGGGSSGAPVASGGETTAGMTGSGGIASGGMASGGMAGGGASSGGTAGAPSGGSSAGGGAGGASGGGGVPVGGGGADGGSGGGSAGAATDIPADTSKEGFKAFLESDEYKSWYSQTDAPRETEFQTSPHGRVRVFMSERLVAAKQAGIDGDPDPYPAGSMAVKELYDDGDMLVGRAAMLKAADGKGSMTWLYYCNGPEGRCATSKSGEMYGKGLSDCNFCHGEFFYVGLEPLE